MIHQFKTNKGNSSGVYMNNKRLMKNATAYKERTGIPSQSERLELIKGRNMNSLLSIKADGTPIPVLDYGNDMIDGVFLHLDLSTNPPINDDSGPNYFTKTTIINPEVSDGDMVSNEYIKAVQSRTMSGLDMTLKRED
jgi:hypothetical protein